MNLYLTGYRCTGKTTVGKALAERLGWPLVDTDQIIIDAIGCSITELVDKNGWTHFRKQERITLEAVASNDHLVVSTGGGIILDARNIDTMKKTGMVVWLTASEQTIQTRMLADDATSGNRPSLTRQGLIEEIGSVLSERQPLYEKAADLTIATDGEPVSAICDQIENVMKTQ